MKFHDGGSSGDRTAPEGRTSDLRSQAVLDAMGMLDEVEAAAFDRDFRNAPAAVQAELRAVQADVAADPVFRGTGEPPADLKLRTLTRVMSAVEEQESQLAPIAHIGMLGQATRDRAGVPARRSVSSIDAQDLVDQAMELAVLRSDMDRFVRSSRVWRAASFALMAGLLAALAFNFATQGLAGRIAEAALGMASHREIYAAMGQESAGALLQTGGTRLSTAVRGGGAVLVAMNPVTKESLVYAFGLTSGRSYVVEHVGADGAVTTLAHFEATLPFYALPVATPEAAARALGVPGGRIRVLDGQGNDVSAT